MTKVTDSLRILVVDDEDLVRDFLMDLLETAGHEVNTAENGKIGIEKALSWQPDVIITDICMPHTDGLQLLEQVRQQPDPPPVMLLTGYGDLQSAVSALRKGAFDYMLKPIESDDLLSRLDRFVRMRRLERKLSEEKQRSMMMARMAAVGQLAAGVAHEINNPTTYLRGNAQILRALLKRLQVACASDDPEQREVAIDMMLVQVPELIDGIEDGTERIKRITHGLSCFASGQQYEPHDEGCVNTCIEDTLFLIGDTIGAVDLELDLEDNIPLIPMSRRAVTQALLCLILNACQAVQGQDSPRVCIRTRSDENEVRVEVEDSGEGVPAELRERVFEPFFTTRDVDQGSGLGLAVAYGIVCTDHHGELRIGDSLLGGARVVMRLPREESAEETQPGSLSA